MVKILKKGKLPETKTYVKVCPNCKTEYEFEQKEAKQESSPRNEDYWVIQCPFCKLYNYFDYLL